MQRECSRTDRGVPRAERDRKKENREKVLIKLPFVNDEVVSKVQKVLKASDFLILAAWTNQNTLKRQLVRSALKDQPCPSGRQHCHACQAGLRGKCSTKNVVYESKRSLCNKTYV